MENSKKQLLNMLSTLTHPNVSSDGFQVFDDTVQLVFLTAAGQITGTPYVPGSDLPSKDLQECALNKVFQTVRDTSLKLSDDTSSSFILLKDAKITTSSFNTFEYSFLYVFTDDIIAVSIGEFEPHSA